MKKDIINNGATMDFSKYAVSIDDSYPLVSIIIPCYNDGKYLYEAIESALSQTYPSVEIVVINDASTDPLTIEVLDYISHPRITVCHNPKNLHLSGARNKGISLAKGKYILPLDADDKIDESYVKKAVQIIEGDISIGVVYCRANLFGLKDGLWDLPDYSFEHMLKGNIVFAASLFRKGDWEKIGGYSEDLKAGLEDYDFWLSILALGKEIYQIPEVLFHYRIKESSMTTELAADLPMTKQAYEQIYLRHPDFYDKHRDKYAKVLRDAVLDTINHIRHFENELTAANETICKLECEKEQIEHSTSWRITRPARLAADAMRKLLNKMRR